MKNFLKNSRSKEKSIRTTRFLQSLLFSLLSIELTLITLHRQWHSVSHLIHPWARDSLSRFNCSWSIWSRVHYKPHIYIYIHTYTFSPGLELNATRGARRCTDTESEATLSRHGGRHVQTSVAFPFPPRVASRAYARGRRVGGRKRWRGGEARITCHKLALPAANVDTEPGVHAVFPEKCLQVLPAYLMRLCALRFEPSGSVTGNLLPKEIITSGLGACRLELWVLLLTKYRNTATFHHSSRVSLLRFHVSFRNHEFVDDKYCSSMWFAICALYVEHVGFVWFL